MIHEHKWERSWFCGISRKGKLIRGESQIYFHTQCVIMTLGDEGGGLSLMTSWNSEELSNFKVCKLSWTVKELCTYLIIDEKRSSNICKISKKLVKLNSYQNSPACILRVTTLCPATVLYFICCICFTSFFWSL